jgi:POT family proton-dependent oligopeptide transporter
MSTVPAPATAGTGPASEHDRSFFGHPRGLSTLFFTEMWERFSFYGMRALLILFMTAPVAAGGLGVDTALAGAVYGLYGSMVYVASLPGGWLADRLIGQRRAVLYGGILIACGHFSMAFPSLTTFYLGLALIVAGTGLLKGNISVMVGQLYRPEDARRDAGFSIYYMGINVGAFFAPLVCGYLGQRVNWHVGFGAAGVGMVLGLIQYSLGGRYLGEAGLHPAPAESPEAAARLRRQACTWGGSILAVGLVGAAGMVFGWLPITAMQVTSFAGLALLLLAIGLFAWLFFGCDWTPAERRRLYVVGALFLASALFWAEFEQAGSSLNLFADRSTRTSVFGWEFPSSYFQALQPLFVIICAPLFAWMWIRLGRREPSSPAKFSMGLLLVGAGFVLMTFAAKLAAGGVQVSPWWLFFTYLIHTFGELSLSPVGLSVTTKLAPQRVAGLMMGVWFLGISVGEFMGGQIASLYGSMPLPSLFGTIGAIGIVAGLVLFALSPAIRRLMGDVN